MRDKLIDVLNAMLELDHDLMVEEFLRPIEIPMRSPLYKHRMTAVVDGRRYLARLDIMGLAVSELPIIMKCEDGIIQRFE